MKKRLFATLLACAMTVSLVACGGSSSSSEKKEDTSDSKKQEASTEKEVTDITKMSDDEIKKSRHGEQPSQPNMMAVTVHQDLAWQKHSDTMIIGD
mgnify:CR=1 FL=1